MNLVSPAAGLSRVSLLVRYATRLPFIVAVVAGFLALTPSDGLALSVGDRVVVACSNPQGLRVRSTAMLSGAIVGGVYDGATGSVVNGPVSRDGYTWVRVSWDYSASQTGWSADCWLVKELARPTLSSPPNYGTIQGSSVTFSWTASGSPSGYNLRVGTSPGSSNILDQTTISPSYTATGLQSGTYYWQVLSIKLCPSCSGSSGGAFSPYSSYRSFTVSAVPQTFDLVPEDVYFTTQPNGGGTRTDSPSAGQSLYPAFQYRVSGSGGSKTGTLAEMWLGSTSLGTITGTANPSAGTVVRGLSSPVTIPSGSFVLKVELDPVDDFQDTKSSNNVFTRSYNVAPPSSFDFQIKDVYLGDSSGRKVTTPRAGDRLYPAVKYSLSVSKGSFVGRAWRIDYDSNAPVFAPSGTSGSAVDRVAVSPTAVTVSEGCHTLSATLNPDGVFGETNTGNNHMSLPPFVAKKSGQPDPPSGVSATQGTLEDRVQVTWPASSGAAKYRVYASPGSSSFLFETAQQRFDHGAAKVGTVYTYSVSGVTLSGVEGPRSCVSATGWRKGTAPVTMKVEPLTGLFFNLVGVGQSRDLKIKISNIGGGTLTGSISGLPQGFSVVGSSAFSIPAGQPPQELTVRFQPTTKKVYEGNAVVSGGSSTVVVPLKGEGGTPTPTGSIRCWIRDHFNSSRLIAGATVQCGGRTFTAAPDGSYLLNDVLPGTYNVRAWRSADPDRFDPKEQSVSVTQGSEKRIDITVKITPPTALPPPNEIPVVLVRGLEWLPVVTESVEVAYWADMRQTLIDAGYCFNSKHGTPVIWDANVLWDTDAFRWKMRSPKTINGAEGIAINADRLSAFIDNQFGIYADSKGYYPKQINIVAHSMGGLVVRQMLKNRSDIAERTGQVIMIATPNAGSPFADAAVVALFSAQVHSLFTVGSLMKASVWTMLVEALEAVGADYLVPSEAIANLTVTHVEFIWGPQTPWRSGPRLHQIAGDPSTAQCSWFYKGFHLILQMLGDNDGVVPVRSVIGFYFKDSKGPRGYQAFPDAPSDLPRGASRDHSELLEDAAVLNQVRAWLAQSPSRSARDEQVLPLSSVPKHRDVPEPVGVHLAPVCNLTGTVAPNSIEERLIALDSEGSAVISVALEDLSVSFTLVAPSRTVITSDNAADSGSTHSRVLLPNSRFAYESYTVAAEPGIWTARVAATSETTQPVAFTISAELETTMTLECSAPERVRSGQGIALTARLFDADTSTVVVLPGASFVATVQEPGGTTWTAVLADDGLVGDGDPLDGVFGAVLDGLTTPGIYGATCNASGSTEAGFAYSRVSGWIFAVADNYGRLTGGFDQEYMDIDADGSTETLRVGVMLSLDKASTYSVTARLDNASGSESIGTVRYSTGLSTGTEQLDLLFQLADFADPDEVGPFTLRDVTLSEETYDGMVWLDRLSGPFAIPAVGARRPVVVDFQTTASAAWEGQAASIQIALTRKSDQPVSVMLAPVGGTASGAGVDYFLDPVRVDFLPGEVSRTVTVPIVDDALMEGDETVEIVLSAPENALLGSATTHTLTILDDDLPDVAVAVRPWPDPPEKGGVAEFTVTARNKGRADATSVALAVELSPNLAFESAYSVGGTVLGTPPGAVWAVGPLAMGQVTTMTLRARQLDNAYSGTTVTATLAQPDLAPLDNTASWNGTPVEMEIVLLPGGVPLEMVRIPAGSFLMGSPSDSGWSRPNESPQHPVRIGYDYLAGRYEITQEQWTALSTTSPALAHGTGANLPIHNLSWDEIAGPGGFVERLNAHVSATGQGESTFRLPSESEWEYMCRANSTTRFWFGDSNCDPLGCTDCLLQDTDWYCSTEFSPPGVKPVHSLTPNPFGLFHVHGNVHEWCADTYRADHGNAPADGSAWLDFGGGSHVIRGGAFDSPPVACRSAHRGHPAEWPDNSSFGFRLVRTIPSTRADLAVSLTAAPNPAAPGYPVTFSLTARNLGPMGVEDVILTQTLPAGVTVEDFQCAGGTAAVVGADKVVFEWPWLARDASATASLTLVQADAGTLNTTATVTGQCLDTTRTNNVASASVLVSGPAIAVSPSPLAAVGILGQDAPAGTLNVRNMGAGFMSYTIASDAPWLSVTPASGDSSGEVDPITLHFSTAALPTGEHRANLTITSPEACNSPLVVPVSLSNTCLQGFVIHDDFNDNILDASLWEPQGRGRIQEVNGRLEIEQTITDGYAQVITKPFSLKPSGKLTISRRALARAAGNYVHQTMSLLSSDQLSGYFRVWYAKYDYHSPPIYQATYGIGITTTDCAIYTQSCSRSDLIPAIWDQWFDERVEYYPASGLVRYYINEQLRITWTAKKVSGEQLVRVSIYPYGWWTGHYQYTDDFSIHYDDASSRTDISFQEPSKSVYVDLDSKAIVALVVKNAGDQPASDLRLDWPLPAGLTPLDQVVSQGTVNMQANTLQARFGSLDPGGTAVLTATLHAANSGQFVSVASVSMSECDDNSMNNDAIITVTVKPRADVGVSVGPLATPAVVGATVGIPVAVTNHGPGNASDVVLTATLSAGAIVERVETTTGTATAGPGGAATWHCGALGAGQTTTVTLFVKPDAAALASGRLTVEAQVASTAPVDHVPGNNRASATARVIRDFVDLGEGVLLELVHVPEGSYLPGPDDPDWGTAGGTTVTVEEDYYIGRFEVTQAQWQRLIAENPATGAGTGQNVPVYNVSWSDLTSAGGFIARLNDHVTSTGQGPATFRLPTEAQWELACRAGSEARFSFGDSDCTTDTCGSCSLGEYAWYCGNNGAQGAADFGAKAVGTRLPNALDIFDMHGNVAEWCSDETSTDPVAMRAVRGGDWASQPLYAACSFRDGADANLRSPTIGFRVLRTRPLAPMADLKIAADVSPTVTRPDYPTTFTLTVSNAGPDVANDVVVTSTLTSNLTVASAESTSGTLVETGGVLICDLGRMEVGTTETITIVALADPVAPGTTANAAITAVAGADEHDPDPASNTAGAAAVVRDDIVILPGEIPLELVPVSAGTFVMGAGLDPGWSGPTEGPEHEVTLGYNFQLGRHEVTQAQWRALMAASPASGYGEGPNHPVYSVSWNEIAGPDGFIARLNRHVAATRQGPGSFRLPSEAEWEYGCRASAGPATRFSFGDSNCGPNLCGGCDLDDHAWYCGNNGFPGAPDFGAKPVGGRAPNALGAHDMHGNVAEWCADWWHADYNGAPVDGRVWADPPGSNRVVRGGNWAARPAQVASAYRGDSAPPDSRSVTVGFRVARGEPTTTTLSDLQITLEADPEPVLAGDALLYFLTVTNHGPDMANDIVLTQTLPLNAVFLADHSTTGLMGEDGMVTASLGALGAGAAAEMVVAVQPTDEGLLLSGAEVSVSETDHNPSNNSDVVATRVIAVGDLAVESVASSGTVVQGGAAVWSDVVTNHGPSTARGALLWHALADGMEFDASRSTPGMTEVSGGLVALELGDLASGASTTVTVAARATIVGDTLTTAAAAVEVFDPMLDNNIATTTLVVSPNTAPAAGIQPVGGPVMSPVPLDFSLHDAESDPCRLEAAYSLDGGGVWTTATVAGPITGLGSSPFGVAHTVAWDAMADLGTTWGVVARLRITPSDEWQTGTAAETDAFTVDTVIPSADLAVTKTGVPDSVEVTGVATYTVGVTNRGPASAPDVVVADTLLTGMELVSASVTTGTVGIADQLVTATVTALEPGEATTMTLQVRMAKPGIFVNAASALSSRPDPVPANNTAFAQTTVTLGCTSRDELLTTAGWELFLKEPNEMDPQYADFSGIDYDPANSALRCRVSSDPGTAGTDAAPLNGAVGLFRAAGWKTRDPYAAATLPYASIGTNGVARTKWFVYATGNEPAQVNTIPATRMMIHNRFIVSTTLEVFTHVNDGTASFNGNVLGQDIAPSTDPERPSLYRCDYDPVDAPFLIANSQTEGLSRGFIAQGDKPQDNGYICLAETVTACYPKVLTDGMLVQRLLPSASDAGALRIAGVKPVSDVGGSVHLRFSYPFNEASGRISMVDFDSGPTMTEGPFGVTLDSTEYDNQPVGNPPMGTRAGILLLGFYPGDDLAARPRVEPGKQYRVRFHVTGTQQSNLQAQLRLQVNTGANTYAQKYELGGPQSGGAQAQQLAKEVLPGIGNSNPSGEYDLLMYTPLSLGIRPDAPDIKSAFPNWMLFAGPGIDDSGATAYPAGLNRRDLRIQVVLIDTLSYGPKAILEKGNYTIDRIEVYAQDAVDDGSPM